DRFGRERGGLALAIQVGRNRVSRRVSAAAGARRATGGLLARHHLQRRLAVLLLHDLLDVLVSHGLVLAYAVPPEGAQHALVFASVSPARRPARVEATSASSSRS